MYTFHLIFDDCNDDKIPNQLKGYMLDYKIKNPLKITLPYLPNKGDLLEIHEDDDILYYTVDYIFHIIDNKLKHTHSELSVTLKD